MSTPRVPRQGTNSRIDTSYKARDRAFILPLVGALLLVPPLAGIFQLDIKIAGVPFTVIYLFSVWAVLIVGAALVSRRLLDAGELNLDNALNDARTQVLVERRGGERRRSARADDGEVRRLEP